MALPTSVSSRSEGQMRRHRQRAGSKALDEADWSSSKPFESSSAIFQLEYSTQSNLSGYGIREEQHERSDDQLGNITRPASKKQEFPRTNEGKVGIGRNGVESRELRTSHRGIKYNVVCGSKDKGEENNCYDQQGK
ncbi:MAG: hypothetical protein LQ352_003421 [Teloschistes flavicans]|nr:MAG: hypothetical protein LQ352_003421 [Teloschistes flavicans]